MTQAEKILSKHIKEYYSKESLSVLKKVRPKKFWDSQLQVVLKAMEEYKNTNQQAAQAQI